MYIYNYFKCKGFSGGSAGKLSTCNVGDLDLIPGLGRSPGKEMLPTLVFWPGEFHRLLDMTEQLSFHFKCKWIKCTNQKTWTG